MFLATDIGFLWFNLVGCAIVMGVSLILSPTLSRTTRCDPRSGPAAPLHAYRHITASLGAA